MKNKRALRRHHANRVKAKMRKYYGKDRELTDKDVGRFASTHGAGCSCWMCGNPRRYMKGKEKLTIQERKQNASKRFN